MRTANALPAGFFYLQTTVQDSTHAFGLMDVLDSNDTASLNNGVVRLNQPGRTHDSQLWAGGGTPGHSCPPGQVHCGAGYAPPSPECLAQ